MPAKCHNLINSGKFMTNELLYITAIDENGNLVHINDADKCNDYYCPLCKNKFILRKSGKTGKGSKRPHFAHNELTLNCTPESALHYSFKKKLVDLLNKYKSENRALIVNWTCKVCSADYSKTSLKRNLIETTVSIEEEYNLHVCRPDIVLLDINKKVIAAIEIVVTHEPDENALKYYGANGITLIIINVISGEDLDSIEEKITNPDIVNYCINPKCPNFDFHSANRKLKFGFVGCKNCGIKVKTFLLEAGSVFGKMRTEILTESELKLIEANGVQLKIKTDDLTGIHYPEVKCLNCEIRYKIMRSKYNRRPL